MSAIQRRAQPWLGTIVSIDVASDADAPPADAAFAGAFAAIQRVHAAMSPQCEGSDVARFNAAARGAVLVCDPWTVRVLQIAQRLERASGGLFNVALGSASGTPYLILDAVRVRKREQKTRIDLGGIAKGYAVDRAVLALRRHGVRRGLVNAGGDLRAFGPGAWAILVDGAFAALALERGALATSQYRNGRSFYRDDALIAPSTRAVHAIDRTITVAAPRCVLADAMTKVVALSGDAQHPLLRMLGGHAWLH
jgi:thiamine biosynthesis lipoprotein